MAKSFDYKGAKKAGYSDEEIMSHLAQSRPKFDFDGALKAGYSPEEINEYLSKPEERSKLQKSGRLASQFAIGRAENLAIPYELAVAPLASKSAQHAKYRENIFEDLERLQEQKASGQWDEQDQELYNSLVEQVKNPEKAQKFVKTADIGVRGLAEKATGLDLKPEGFLEHAASISGNLFGSKELKKLPKTLKSLANKEARQTINLQKQWNNLERAAAGNTEKQTLLNFAKSHSLSPEETNLLFHSKGNARILESTAKKSKKVKSIVRGLKDKIGNNYESLKKLGKDGGNLDAGEIDNLTTDLYKILEDTGKTFIEGPDTKSARGVIENAIEKINNKSGTVEDLINSRQGLKQSINWKNVDQGDVILKRADKAFLDAIEKKNPAVYESLLNTDKAWAKYKQFSKVLGDKSPLLKFKGVALPMEVFPAIAYGASYLFGGIKGLAAKEILQRLSTEIMINPAFRSPLRRLQENSLKGSLKGQKQAFLVIKNILKTEDPELYSKVKDLEVD